MKALFATICIFLSVSTFLKKEEMKRAETAEKTISFDGHNYEVLRLADEGLTNVFIERIANSVEDLRGSNAFVVVREQTKRNGKGDYFIVPLNDEEGVQQFIQNYGKIEMLQNEDDQSTFDSPLAFRGQ